jgi:hypothetical protein
MGNDDYDDEDDYEEEEDENGTIKKVKNGKGRV